MDHGFAVITAVGAYPINPLSRNSDLSSISHSSIKVLLVREVVRIENMINQVKF